MMAYDVTRDAHILHVRQALADFAELMEAKLRANDHKTGWETYPIEAIRRLMMVEIEEFNVAREFFGHAEAQRELIDIANFAMILHNRLGQLIEEETRTKQTAQNALSGTDCGPGCVHD